MPRLLGILAAACLLVTTAQARIGETEAEVKTRYGDPVVILPAKIETSLTKCYLTGGFSVAVTYIDGRSAREMFAKADKSKITDKEIQRLLKTNAGSASWNVQQLDGENVPAGLVEWRTNDQRSRVAFYDARTHAFFVTTQYFINQTNTMNRQAVARASREGSLAHRDAERLLRNVQQSSVAGALRGQQPGPTPSPASK